MKNNLFLSIVLILAICFSSGCGKDEKPNHTPYMIHYDFIGRPYWEPWQDKGKEINVKLDIRSEFSDDAYLVLWAEKEYWPYTIYHVHDPVMYEGAMDSTVVAKQPIYEGFKDSLKIDGFHIRSYYIFRHFYDDPIDGTFVGTPVDFPVYLKYIRVRKGKNSEKFKIVFPRDLVSIPGRINVLLGIGRFNDEIKSRFENFPGDYELSEPQISYYNLYFENFPDSSKTSLVFSSFLGIASFYPDNFQKHAGKHYFFSQNIFLNIYSGAPRLWYEEYIYR